MWKLIFWVIGIHIHKWHVLETRENGTQGISHMLCSTCGKQKLVTTRFSQ